MTTLSSKHVLLVFSLQRSLFFSLALVHHPFTPSHSCHHMLSSDFFHILTFPKVLIDTIYTRKIHSSECPLHFDSPKMNSLHCPSPSKVPNPLITFNESFTLHIHSRNFTSFKEKKNSHLSIGLQHTQILYTKLSALQHSTTRTPPCKQSAQCPESLLLLLLRC